VNSAADEGDPLRGQAVDWLMRIHAQPDDADLRAALETWLAEAETHRIAYRSVERVWRLAGDLPAAAPAPAATVVEFAGARHPHRTKGRAVGIATAALAACIALYFFPALQLRLQADHLTGVAELRELRLEDGSVVALDAGSAVAVRYSGTRREVALLAGQAFFQVVSAPERPFVVAAGDVRVSVTGTAFDVRSLEGGVTVAVQSGTVEVALDRGDRLAATLTRGQRFSVGRDGQIAKSQVAPDDVGSWRERRLVVDGATLGEVVEELGRHHAGMIVLRDRTLADRRITGVFDLRRPVEALQAIVRTQHGSVTEITPYLLVVSAH
jgi:transmembrane sensor